MKVFELTFNTVNRSEIWLTNVRKVLEFRGSGAATPKIRSKKYKWRRSFRCSGNYELGCGSDNNCFRKVQRKLKGFVKGYQQVCIRKLHLIIQRLLYTFIVTFQIYLLLYYIFLN